MESPAAILFLTVGGSHEPIVKAITQRKPDRVIFFCTGRDPGTGRVGSCTQITGTGHVIKARREDEQPTVPNIPTLCGLAPDAYETVEVPPDHLDGAFEIISKYIGSEARRDPEARLIADYTGGTKTMSAALVLAALEHPGVELELVTGNRPDLLQVRSGTEHLAAAAVERLRTRRMMEAALQAWERHAYDEAAQALERIATPKDPELVGELNRARDLSRAFAAWDRFDHAEAFRLLDLYAPKLISRIGAGLGLLRLMKDGRDPARAEALRIWDLWLNAERRAVAGRYDDAVARLYRVIEWTAQWLLRAHLNIDTADVPRDKIPPGLDIPPGRDGRRQAGLFAAWQLLAHHRPQSAAGRLFADRQGELLDLLKARNGSILAHGFAPVGAGVWDRMYEWTEANLLPVLKKEAEALGQRVFFEQLPVTIHEALRLA